MPGSSLTAASLPTLEEIREAQDLVYSVMQAAELYRRVNCFEAAQTGIVFLPCT
jgi:hypothetical protein